MHHSSLGYALIRENLHGGMHTMSTSSLADLIAPQLPYLRRFARALMGSQDRGEMQIRNVLERSLAHQDLVQTLGMASSGLAENAEYLVNESAELWRLGVERL